MIVLTSNHNSHPNLLQVTNTSFRNKGEEKLKLKYLPTLKLQSPLQKYRYFKIQLSLCYLRISGLGFWVFIWVSWVGLRVREACVCLS